MSGNAGPKKNFWVQAWSAMNGMIQFGALSPRDDVTSSVELKGLDEGYYYVKVLDAPNNNQIKLYQSRSLIELDGTLDPKTGSPMNTAMGFIGYGSNNHSFILAHQKSDKISPQKFIY